jgi:hypothetical protein
MSQRQAVTETIATRSKRASRRTRAASSTGRAPRRGPTNVRCRSTCCTPTPRWPARPPGQILIADKNYYGRDVEATLAEHGIDLLRRARKGEPEPTGARFLEPLRQAIESIFDTFMDQLDLQRHGGHTPADVTVPVLQRILALTAATRHHDRTGQTIRRSLLAYDHQQPLESIR